MTQEQAAAEGFVQSPPAPSASTPGFAAPGTNVIVPEHPTGAPGGNTQMPNPAVNGQSQQQ